MSLSNLSVNIGADTSGFSEGIRAVNSGIQSTHETAENVSKSLTSLTKKLGAAILAAFSISTIANFSKECKSLYQIQQDGEVKLETIMRQRMNATDDTIQSIKDYASSLQEIGVIGDEVQLAGAQQVATFLNQADSLKTLMPAMNNLLAQQNGLNASAQDAVNIGNLMGKAMQGQVGALTRVGITFSDAEEKVLKYGNESERAAMLAKVITNNVGDMNAVLAQTDLGRQQQLSNTIGDIKEQFGQAVTQIQILFLPVLKSLANVLETVAEFAQKAAQAISNVFGKSSRLTTSTSAIAGASNEVSESYSNMAENAETAQKANKKMLAGFDSLNTLSTQSNNDTDNNTEKSGTNIVSSPVVKVDSDTDELTENLSNALEKIKDKLKPVTDSLSNLWDTLKPFSETIGSGLKWFWDNVLKPLGEWTITKAVPTFLDSLGEAIQGIDAVWQTAAPVIKEELWDEFLKPISKFAADAAIKAIEGIGKGIKKLGESITERQVKALITLGKAVGIIVLACKGYNVISSAATAIKTLVSTKIAPWFTEVFASLGSTVTMSLGTVFAGIASFLVGWQIGSLIYDTWGEEIDAVLHPIFDFFVNLFTNIDTVAKTTFSGICAWLKGLANTAWSNIQKAFSKVKEWATDKANGIKSAFLGIELWFKGLFEKAWNNIKSAWSNVKKWFSDLWNSIKSVFSNVGNWFKEKFQSAWDNITSIFSGIGNWFSNRWNDITSAFSPVGTWFGERFSEAWQGIKNAFAYVKSWFSERWNDIAGIFGGVGDWFSEKFQTAYDNITGIFSGIGDWFRNIWADLSNGAKEGINWIIEKINGMISLLNGFSFDLPEVMGGETIGFSIAEIPYLAEGGIVNSPTLAMIGEAGKEAVLPLQNNTGWISDISSKLWNSLENMFPKYNNQTLKIDVISNTPKMPKIEQPVSSSQIYNNYNYETYNTQRNLYKSQDENSRQNNNFPPVNVYLYPNARAYKRDVLNVYREEIARGGKL